MEEQLYYQHNNQLWIMTKKTNVQIVNKLRIEKLKTYLTTSNTLKTIKKYIWNLKKQWNNDTDWEDTHIHTSTTYNSHNHKINNKKLYFIWKFYARWATMPRKIDYTKEEQ